jgi:gas vesicle protein
MEDNKGVAYFFLGLGIGVAVGMIFAPQAGAETRTLLRTRAQEGGDYIRRRGDELKSGAGELVERSKSVVNRQKERLNASVEAGKQAYRDALGSGQESGVTTEIGTPSEGI